MALEEDFNETMLQLLRDVPMHDIYQVQTHVQIERDSPSESHHTSRGMLGERGWLAGAGGGYAKAVVPGGPHFHIARYRTKLGTR